MQKRSKSQTSQKSPQKRKFKSQSPLRTGLEFTTARTLFTLMSQETMPGLDSFQRLNILPVTQLNIIVVITLGVLWFVMYMKNDSGPKELPV